MSALGLLASLVVGALVAANPWTAPLLCARVEETSPARALLEASLLVLLLALVVGALAWAFAPFISGRLTNALLYLGLFVLAAALYAFRPLGRRVEAPPAPPQGWRWITRFATDAFYFYGPAWLVATLAAMRTLTAAAFALPYAATAAGILAALAAWLLLAPKKLPDAPPRRGAPIPRGTRPLGVAYGLAGAFMIAGNLGLL